jgi:hypothetical protein
MIIKRGPIFWGFLFSVFFEKNFSQLIVKHMKINLLTADGAVN